MVPYGDKNGWFLGKGFFISIHTSVWEVTIFKKENPNGKE